MEPRPARSSSGGAATPLDRLFVYGTLMAGLSRHRLLGTARFEGAARLRGSLYDLEDYPGVVLDESGWVFGELYHVPDLPSRMAALDREEWYDPGNVPESLYVRRPVTVTCPGRGSREAWAYVYNGPSGRGRRIPSGDWRAHLPLRAGRLHSQGGRRWAR